MIEFMEIKKDIMNGCSYKVYSGKWYGTTYSIILDMSEKSLEINMEHGKLGNHVSAISVDEFLAIRRYREFFDKIREHIYTHLLK